MTDVRQVKLNNIIINQDTITPIVFNGIYTCQQISDILVENLVSYTECHQCPMHSLCPYPIPHPANKYRCKDIKCVIEIKHINNYTKQIFDTLISCNDTEKPKLLQSIINIWKQTVASITFIGTLNDDDLLSWHGPYAARAITSIVHSRDNLNLLSKILENHPNLHHKKTYLFVEGESEHAFFKTIAKSKSFSFSDIEIKSYKGAGQLKKLIRMLFDDKVEQGYAVFLQGDLDGKHEIPAHINQLMDSGLIHDFFLFKHDFESAFPPEIFIHGMIELNLISPSERQKYLEMVKRNTQSYVQTIQDSGIDLGHHKVELGICLAKAILPNLPECFSNTYIREHIEIYTFLYNIFRFSAEN
ncbi:MAG: hypothetical protein AB7E76_02990 [Deferribacterales bacterium]